MTRPVRGADLRIGDTIAAIDGPHAIDHFREYPGQFVGDHARRAYDADEHWRVTVGDHEMFHVRSTKDGAR